MSVDEASEEHPKIIWSFQQLEPHWCCPSGSFEVGEVQLLQCPIEEPLVKYLKVRSLESWDNPWSPSRVLSLRSPALFWWMAAVV